MSLTNIAYKARQISHRASGDTAAIAKLIEELVKECKSIERTATDAERRAKNAEHEARRD